MEPLVLKIIDLARGGAGVGKADDGKIVFVPYTAPGDIVEAVIYKSDKRYAYASLLKILQSSPIRVKPPCPVFTKCGGCDWQHLSYETQWERKFSGVKHAIKRVGLVEPKQWEEFPAKRIWEYRNRVQLRGFQNELGFFSSQSRNLVPIERCEIARPEINQTLNSIRQQGKQFEKPYKVELEVNANGEVFSFWNTKHAAGGFRQVHDEQNEVLKKWIANVVTKDRELFDLYGGNGNFSLHLANQMLNIHCVDVKVPQTSSLPKNYFFHRQPVASWLAKNSKVFTNDHQRSAILDPPRIGLEADFNKIEINLIKLNVTEVILVGCDPDAWARDVYRFFKRSWQFQRAAIFDLFPQTHHVESVALLQR